MIPCMTTQSEHTSMVNKKATKLYQYLWKLSIGCFFLYRPNLEESEFVSYGNLLRHLTKKRRSSLPKFGSGTKKTSQLAIFPQNDVALVSTNNRRYILWICFVLPRFVWYKKKILNSMWIYWNNYYKKQTQTYSDFIGIFIFEHWLNSSIT